MTYPQSGSLEDPRAALRQILGLGHTPCLQAAIQPVGDDVLGLQILSAAHGLLLRRGRALLRTLTIPAIAVAGIEGLATREAFGLELAWSGAALLLEVRLVTVAYGALLLGIQAPPWAILTWRLRDLRFLLWWLVTGTLLALPIGLAGAVWLTWNASILGSVALAHAALLSLYLGVRLRMCLPAIAVDAHPGILVAWQRSRGRTLGMACVLLPLMVPLLCVVTLDASLRTSELGFLRVLLCELGYCIAVTIEAALLGAASDSTGATVRHGIPGG